MSSGENVEAEASQNIPSQSEDNSDIRTKEFGKILTDFVRDLLITFPELEKDLDTNLAAIRDGTFTEEVIKTIRDHCTARLPERFFDILYQNEDMFANEELDLYFLPGINFGSLWTANISDKTRTTIWKYLQLFLFDTVADMSDGSSFGDTAKLFEAMDQDVFRNKLEDTINHMQSMFTGETTEEDPDDSDNVGHEKPHSNIPEFPDAQKIHDHVSEMMEGKLGKLAKEIAEETSEEMDIDIDNASSINDVFKKLFKNPARLMQLVKNVGSKIDKKLKDGDIKESELIEEATELIKKMKDTPGMGNLQEMFSKMGMPQGGKANTAAMQSQLARRMRLAKQKERMRSHQDDKGSPEGNLSMDPVEFLKQQQFANEAAVSLLKSEGITDGMELFKYSTGDKYDKSLKPEGKKKKKKKKRKGGK